VLPRTRFRDFAWLLLLTAAVVLIHGYHLGIEDQATYLPAVKRMLDPRLYSWDAQFFLAQTRLTLLIGIVTFTVRVTHLPLDVVVFLWHLASVFLFLWSCLRLSRRCFSAHGAQWAGVALIVAVITIPIAGTLMLMIDQYLHPRTLATAAVLFALCAVLDRKLSAFAWLALAWVIHPQIALFGSIHLALLAWRVPNWTLAALVAPDLPYWAPSNAAWRQLLATRRDWLIFQWHWYEWLGAFGPIVLLRWFARLGERQGTPAMKHVCQRLALSGGVTVAAGILVNGVPQLHRFIPLQPMRTLHILYIVLFLCGGSLLGEFVLRNRAWRWALLFVPICTGMVYSQRHVFPDSPHIEWPGRTSRNDWVQAYDWVRLNTPRNAYFALDPRYLERPGEDNHGFRAFAERGMMADYTKDRGVVALFPELAYEWRDQVRAREGWSKFQLADFQQLRAKYGVTWVVVEQPGASGMTCLFENARVKVCRVE